MSKITSDGLTQYGTLYSCTHMATVGVKGLIMLVCLFVLFVEMQGNNRRPTCSTPSTCHGSLPDNTLADRVSSIRHRAQFTEKRQAERFSSPDGQLIVRRFGSTTFVVLRL